MKHPHIKYMTVILMLTHVWVCECVTESARVCVCASETSEACMCVRASAHLRVRVRVHARAPKSLVQLREKNSQR